MRPDIPLRFFIDGKVHAARLWPRVPRVGDIVMLGAGPYAAHADGAGNIACRVREVVWTNEEGGNCDQINLAVEIVESLLP